MRIAQVGLTTSDTKQVSMGPFGSCEFLNEAATLRALLPEVRRRADVVVLLTHCGLEEDRELARQFPEVPLILGGHSHTLLRRSVQVGGTHIVQSGSRGTAVSVVRVQLIASPPQLLVSSAESVDLDESTPRDAAMQSFLDQRFAPLREAWDQPLGRIVGRDSRAGSGSTPGGNLVAALIRADGDAEIGLTNKGGLRTTLTAGPITRRQVFEFLPFDDNVVTLQLSGEQLRATLQQSLRRAPPPGGGWMHVLLRGAGRGAAPARGHDRLRAAAAGAALPGRDELVPGWRRRPRDAGDGTARARRNPRPARPCSWRRCSGTARCACPRTAGCASWSDLSCRPWVSYPAVPPDKGRIGCFTWTNSVPGGNQSLR